MKYLMVIVRMAFVPIALLSVVQLAKTPYSLKACEHGAFCDSFAGTRDATGCGATCDDALSNAILNLNNEGFAACLGANGTCDVEHYTISDPCYFDDVSGQYCEQIEQDYGCFNCI
jgi:hypothetical protein